MVKKEIRVRITRRVTLILVAAILLCSLVLSLFFVGQVQRQVYDRDANSINQIAGQFNTVAADLRNLALGLISDPSVQRIAIEEPTDTDFSGVKSIYDKSRRLKDYQNLRSYLHSIVIITRSGNSYWSIQPYYDDHVFDSYMEMDWYQDTLGRSGVFTGPYEITTNNHRSTEQVFSYVVDFNDKDSPDLSLGRILLNVRLSSMQEMLEQQGTGYDAFLCRLSDGSVGYCSNESLQEQMLAACEQAEAGKTDRRFVVSTDVDFGWTLVSYISQASILRNINYLLYLAVIIGLTALICVAAQFLMRRTVHSMVQPIGELSEAMRQVSAGDLNVKIDIRTEDEIELMARDFNKMLADLRDYIAKSVADEKIKKRMEFELMIAQINPHFIYNTLNTIIYQARRAGSEDIVEITVSLIHLLQSSIHRSESDTLIPLAEELQCVRDYLTIQRYRFGNRFSVIWETEEGLSDILIPQKAVQILVENALTHGVLETEREGEIRILAAREGDLLRICVTDNGPGMTEEKIREVLSGAGQEKDALPSVGIRNIIERVRYIYERENMLSFESETEKYTKATLYIPVLPPKSEKTNKNDESSH